MIKPSQRIANEQLEEEQDDTHELSSLVTPYENSRFTR